MVEMIENIKENISRLRSEVENHSKRCGQKPPRILGATKKKSPETILAAMDAGLNLFGENYAQELEKKAADVRRLRPEISCEWHFIGRLQRNKIRKILMHVNCIQTVDSLETAEAIEWECEKQHRMMQVMIEVNVGNEVGKGGILVSEAAGLVRALNGLGHLEVRGLMTIPPLSASLTGERQYYHMLRELKDDLNRAAIYQKPLDELSMGMSHDYLIAIEEGSTLIRIGEKIFGPRK